MYILSVILALSLSMSMSLSRYPPKNSSEEGVSLLEGMKMTMLQLRSTGKVTPCNWFEPSQAGEANECAGRIVRDIGFHDQGPESQELISSLASKEHDAVNARGVVNAKVQNLEGSFLLLFSPVVPLSILMVISFFRPLLRVEMRYTLIEMELYDQETGAKAKVIDCLGLFTLHVAGADTRSSPTKTKMAEMFIKHHRLALGV